jgi:hypothetical protein
MMLLLLHLKRLVRDQGVGGSKSSLPDQLIYFPFRIHRLHFWPEGVLPGLQGFFLQMARRVFGIARSGVRCC